MKKIQTKVVAAVASIALISVMIVAFRYFDAWFVSHDALWRSEAIDTILWWFKKIGIGIWLFYVWYLFYRLWLYLFTTYWRRENRNV